MDKIRKLKKTKKAVKKESSFHEDRPRKAAVKQRELMSEIMPCSSKQVGSLDKVSECVAELVLFYRVCVLSVKFIPRILRLVLLRRASLS